MDRIGPTVSNTWDPNLYDGKHSFVWELAAEILSWLDPQPGEQIIDLGCGTGHLTAKIAAAGANVVGIDVSAEMIAAARSSYPELDFQEQDARSLSIPEPVNAVFSNATMHWIPEAELAARRIYEAILPGGRFVAEFGGHGNVAAIVAAARSSLQPDNLFDWPNQYYPTPEEYKSILSRAGFEVERIELVPRPTALQGVDGLRSWLQTFRTELIENIPPGERDQRIRSIEDAAREALCIDGIWHADYVRLRVKAVK
jgi:trans-aconitate 2-methyltransferase